MADVKRDDNLRFDLSDLTLCMVTTSTTSTSHIKDLWSTLPLLTPPTLAFESLYPIMYV